MIQKSPLWKGRKISREDIKHQAILSPEIAKRGIQKIGKINNRRTENEIDFSKRKKKESE